MKRFLIVTFLLTLVALLSAKPLRASEGTAELTSTKGEPMRCHATSVLMEDFNYKIVVSCRDLIYPPKPDVFNYMLWVQPEEGNNPERLGELGVGKAEFKTETKFSMLFVTLEKSVRPRTPEGERILEGSVQAIKFLDEGTDGRIVPKDIPDRLEVTPTPTPRPAARNIVTRILGTGLIILAVVVAVIFVVYLVTKRR